MPFGMGYKRKFGGAYGRNVRTRFNRPIGRFGGRLIRRYGSGRHAPFRTGGFRAVRGVNNPAGRRELKFVDTDISPIELDTTGTVLPLNVMAQGSSQSTRIGNKITNMSVFVRVSVNNGTTAGSAPGIRMMLVYDTQVNAALPAITDILTLATINGLTNLANRDRFTILWDRVWSPPMIVNDTTISEFREVFSVYRKFKLDTIFNNTSGGTIADIQTGALYLVGLSNQPSGTTEPDLSGTARVRYTDV